MALTKINNNTLSAITGLPAGVGGSMVKLATQTASADSSIEFTTGIDSTYKKYIFDFIDIKGSADNTTFKVNFSNDGGSTYAVTKTCQIFQSVHHDDDTTGTLQQRTGDDLGNDTADMTIFIGTGNATGEANSGTLVLYNPSQTSQWKNFLFTGNSVQFEDRIYYLNVSGYLQSTSAIDAIKFVPSTGTIASGTIIMYGVI
jgi:hypothetical protein